MPTHYDDIIHLPYHVSQNHPQMSMHDRAAQFAPFAALTDYEAAIGETVRLTAKRRELDAQETEELPISLNPKDLFLLHPICRKGLLIHQGSGDRKRLHSKPNSFF